MAHSEKNAVSLVACEGAIGIPDAPPAHPKSLTLDEWMARTVARICLQARAATRLSQTAWAKVIGTTRDVVFKHESANDDNASRALNLHHMLAMPDEALDVLLAEVAKERLRLGFASRQWIAGREVVHTSEAERLSSFIVESSDVQRALATGAPDEVIVKETLELIDASQELLASRQRAA